MSIKPWCHRGPQQPPSATPRLSLLPTLGCMGMAMLCMSKLDTIILCVYGMICPQTCFSPSCFSESGIRKLNVSVASELAFCLPVTYFYPTVMEVSTSNLYRWPGNADHPNGHLSSKPCTEMLNINLKDLTVWWLGVSPDWHELANTALYLTYCRILNSLCLSPRFWICQAISTQAII